MELSARINTLLRELSRLWDCLKANLYPESFLSNALGFGPKLCERLPQYLMCFAGLYLLCGVLTAVFRFRLGQKPLSSIPRQIHTAISAGCASVLLPLLVLLTKTCTHTVQLDVAPLQGGGDFFRYAKEALPSTIYVVLAFAGALLAVWTPVRSILRYLKTYRLRGIPHMIFEVGTGFYLISVLLLAAAFSNRMLYALILPAGALLGAVQSAGYVPEEDSPPELLNAQNAKNLEDLLQAQSLKLSKKGEDD